MHSTLLNHLLVPVGASLVLKFGFTNNFFPFRDYLPHVLRQLENIFRIITVNIRFHGEDRYVRLRGPSGQLYVFAYRNTVARKTCLQDPGHGGLLCLTSFDLSKAHTLMVTKYEISAPVIAESAPFRLLARTKYLRTLTLIRCHNLPFILALTPDSNQSGHHRCPNLEDLILYVEAQNSFNITELRRMARKRASMYKKLSSITIIGLGELVPGKEVFKLREHVTRVEYRVEERPPVWDDIAR